MRVEPIRRGFTSRLRERRSEIEQATLTRIHSVAGFGEGSDPEYRDGLRRAVAAAIDYGIAAVERSEANPPPIPVVLLSQARLAARHGVKLDTVLRRYLAGYTLLGDFLIEESERGGPLDGASLKRLLRVQAALLDRLIAAVTEEYTREAESNRLDSAEQRRSERVERLLEGELLDTSELQYDFDAHHVAAIAIGHDVEEAIRDLAKALDRRLLLIRRSETAVWAWLGSRRRSDLASFEHLLSQSLPTPVSLAIGEPAQGLGGWRLTHQQARAALPIALRCPEPIVRYADVALLASMLRDDLLVSSLQELYLVPLSKERDGGEVARETLRAYFAAQRNISSAAAAIGVNRRTVANRLQAIETRLGCSLSSAGPDIEAALRLHDLGATTASQAT